MSHRSLVILFSALLVACGSDFATTDVRVEMRAFSVDGPTEIVAPDADGADLVVESAEVNVRDIELYLPDDVDCEDFDGDEDFDCSDDDDDEKITIEGPFHVDLVEGTVAAEVALPVGNYRRVDVRVDDDESDVTFRAVGELDMGDATAEVEIVLDFNEDVRFEGDVEIDGTETSGTLLLGLVAANWLHDVPLQSCVEREDFADGPVTVGEDNSGSGSCSDLENAIRDNVESSGDLLTP